MTADDVKTESLLRNHLQIEYACDEVSDYNNRELVAKRTLQMTLRTSTFLTRKRRLFQVLFTIRSFYLV